MNFEERVKWFFGPGRIFLFSILLLVIAGVSYNLVSSSYTDFDLRNTFLSRWTVYALKGAAVFILIGLVLSRGIFRDLWHQVSPLQRKIFWVLVIGSPVLCFMLTPKQNRIFFDEQIYMSIAQNLLRTGNATMCNHGHAEYGDFSCFWNEYNKQPNGLPVYLSFFYSIFGTSEDISFVAGVSTIAISISALFFCMILLTGQSLVGLFAMALYSATPLIYVWSNTVAAEPLAVAVTILAFLSVLIWLQNPKSFGALFLVVGSFAYTAQVRTESLLMLPLLVLLVVLMDWRRIKEPLFAFAASLTAVLLVPAALHMNSFRNDPWGSTGDRLSTQFFSHNLSINGPFYYENIRFPALITLLALIGIYAFRRSRATVFLFFWFLVSWGIYLFFYAGSYNYGADVRYSLLTYPALIVLASIGLKWCYDKMSQHIERRTSLAVLAVIVFLNWIAFLPLVRAVGFEAVHARNCIIASKKLAHHVPQGALVLAHNPNVWLVRGYNSIQTYSVEDRFQSYQHFFQQYPGGLYFYKNYWCNPGSGAKKFCDMVFEKFDTELIENEIILNFEYGLYRLYPKGTRASRPASAATDAK